MRAPRKRWDQPSLSVPCEMCGKKSSQRVYRLDPRNWHEERRILCRLCSRKHHYTPVIY